MKTVFRIVLFSLFLLSNPLLSEGQNMTDYCQLPSSIGNPTDPNLLLVIDASGSMGWCAYTDKTSSTSCESTTTGKTYVSTTAYEGYFDPSKTYAPDSNGVYVETTPTGTPCVKTCTHVSCTTSSWGAFDVKHSHGCSSTRWPHCAASDWQTSGDCDLASGNYLNYQYMRRIDVLRWALTGGKINGCNNSIQSCNPEAYPNSQLDCDSDGCILLSTDGTTKVKIPWARITGADGGLLFQLKNLSPKPLIGAMFFEGSGVKKTVYIGDFTGSASYDGVNPYKNTITSINYESPGGSTPTAPALWDAYNYLAQNTAQYGGPGPQTGTGNEWKNPMYRCFDNNNDGNCQGNEFQLVPCAKNFVILMTDGQWNMGGTPGHVSSSCSIGSNYTSSVSPDPVVPAYWMHKTGFTNVPSGIQSYVESLYTVGLWLEGTGDQALKNVAMYGSFSRSNTWPGGTSGYPQGTCSMADCGSGKGSGCTALPNPSFPDWGKNVNGVPVPDTYFKAEDATQIKEKIVEIILDMLRRVSAGSAVSILASSEGSGANILQAVYYPKKSFGATEIDWTGEMQNLWYYIDPSQQNTSIREDTNLAGTSGASILNLADDYVLEFYFDTADNKTKAKRYSTAADGTGKTYVDTVLLEDIKNLWETGTLLFQRNLTTSPRTIYTTTDGSTRIDFSTANKTALSTYLQAADATEAGNIINYVHGTDQTGYRSRTVTVETIPGVWKLGDIVDSTPRLQSSIPANSFHQAPPDGYSDSTYLAYIKGSSYLSRGMVYAGANDGMLHAFKLGKLEQTWTGQGTSDKAKLTNPDTTTGVLGSEAWAFIPKNCLPYLKYTADLDYCHLYFVDAPNFLIDASIGGDPNDTKIDASSWKTILIGGMGLGGASKITGNSCTTGATGTCVQTPIADPSDASKGLGYSSYFALNVTDPNNPSLLWEFSNPELGFSTSGPAIVRIGNGSKNGKWFAVFASGPTGPIDTSYRQFLGKSDQYLKLFVLDLKTGVLARTIDTGISNAFGGSLYNATLDADKGDAASSGNYSDDVFYLGYTTKDTATSTWTKGGVLRITTKEDANPANWFVSTVIDNIGPVTSAVAKLQDRTNKNLWLYFGSGRFFYRLGATTDDASGQRALYGLKEPCYNDATAIPPGPTNGIHDTCTSTLTTAVLDNQSSDTPSSTLSSTAMGWYINLAAASGSVGAERVITDPLAAFFGAVFFTTYTPSTEICSAGGNTSIWSVTYDVGGAVGGLQGKAMTQVSTGEIKELDLATAFPERGSRKTVAFTGMPPKGQGLLIMVPPKPLRKILHIKER